MKDVTEREAVEMPKAPATFHSYRELPDNPNKSGALFTKMAHVQHKAGATFWRYTVVSPDYPKPPYPYGLYVEGWEVEPWHMEPRQQQGDFAPPITSAKEQNDG